MWSTESGLPVRLVENLGGETVDYAEFIEDYLCYRERDLYSKNFCVQTPRDFCVSPAETVSVVFKMERLCRDCHALRDGDMIIMDYGNMESDVTRCVRFWIANWVR